MADTNDEGPLPSHIEETIESLTKLHADHHQNATRHERRLGRLTGLLGNSKTMILLSVFMLGWIGLNITSIALGFPAFDPAPFSGLGTASSVLSFYVALLILATQRREYQLAQTREQLTLELAIISEQKLAKVIRLLEESRRDNPQIHDRSDQEAEAMAQAANPQSVLQAIRQTHAEAEKISR
jgi:uncharacterized membrane protein